MSWQNTALCGVCRSHEEVKNLARVVFSITFNQSLVDNASRWRISQPALLIFHEESLSDAFVDNNNRNLRFWSSFVVQLVDCTFKLWNFSWKHLVTHSITYTISIDDEICRKLVLVFVSEHLDCFLQSLFHVLLDNFLTFFLDNMFRIVLAHLFVSWCREPNNRVWTSMAYVNSDKHCSFLWHGFRELHLKQISTNLAVDLTQDIGRFR